MPVPESDSLSIFVVNVGEGDAAVIRTPGGGIVVVDTVAPKKVVRLIMDLGLQEGEDIEELIITHPHRDHFGGMSSLLDKFGVRSVTLPPFWHLEGCGPKSYQALVNRIEKMNVPVDFVSGYSRIYLSDLVAETEDGATSVTDEALHLELLGPPNSLFTSSNIEKKTGYGPNHLSVMAKLVWGEFSMVLAADAQMENWAAFDHEGMLADPCNVLKSSHHGSKNGTQWERLHRLSPGLVIVSSDPDGRHEIPDLIGCAIFRKYVAYKHVVSLTRDTGTIEICVPPSGRYSAFRYADDDKSDIDLSNRIPLTKSDNPTDWGHWLNYRLGQGA